MSRRPYGPLPDDGDVVTLQRVKNKEQRVKPFTRDALPFTLLLMLLAGDIGGTKTLLGLFSAAPERPTPIEIGEFITLDYGGLESIIREFLKARAVDARLIDAACFG